MNDKIDEEINKWMQWEKTLGAFENMLLQRWAEEIDEKILALGETPIPDYILKAFEGEEDGN